jgi:hypothetical protein
MTGSNSSADTFLPQIEEKLLAYNETEQAMEEIDKTKGPHCGDRLRHAIECGKLLMLAKESCKSETLVWKTWLQDHFGSRLGYSTAELWIKLGDNEEFLLDQMKLVANKRMSVRQACELIPKSKEGLKRSAAAKVRAEKNKTDRAAAEKAKVIEEVKGKLSTEDRVGDLALDEILLAKGEVDVGEVFMALKSCLNADQLLDLSTRLNSYVNEEADKAEAKPDEAEDTNAAYEKANEALAQARARRV